MAQHEIDTKQTLQAVIEEYEHADMALVMQIPTVSVGVAEQTEERLLIMAHAHIHAAISLMKSAGRTRQQIAGDFYDHADIQAAP